MQEVELKLTLPSAQPERLLADLSAVPALALAAENGGVRHTELHNVYFDTPANVLHSQRIALRTRRKGNASQPQWLQTLKIGGSNLSALSQRGEWEFPIANAQLSHTLLQQTPWSALDPDGALFAELQPCFATVFERTLWWVNTPDGSRVEVAFDSGQVQAGGKTSPICELELELQAGQASALFDLAGEIATTVAVLPATVSKAQRGFALAQGAKLGLGAPRNKSVALQADTAQQNLQRAFAQWSVCLNNALQSTALDDVLQLRVAARSFRAVVRYFSPMMLNAAPLMPHLNAFSRKLNLAMQQDFNQARRMVIEALQDPKMGAELLKISRWLELDFEQ